MPSYVRALLPRIKSLVFHSAAGVMTSTAVPVGTELEEM
jgi:hypothetical protein